MVVDHVEEQLELACLMLKSSITPYRAPRAGKRRVELCTRQNSADLVVLDMMMDPGIDGLATTGILELHPGQRAIIVSGFSETERVTKAQALGAGHVKKPYILEKLGMAVRNGTVKGGVVNVNRESERRAVSTLRIGSCATRNAYLRDHNRAQKDHDKHGEGIIVGAVKQAGGLSGRSLRDEFQSGQEEKKHGRRNRARKIEGLQVRGRQPEKDHAHQH